jgi:predicted TPR repeat methyltransferase
MPGDNSIPYHDKPDPWSSHSIISEWLKKCPPGSRVLDIGTGTGSIGRFCEGLDLVFRGIEPNLTWADLAKPYYNEIYNRLLEQLSDDYLMGHQVVVCADVLEHMANPGPELARLVRLQVPGTYFMISIPNIANIWVRFKLLFGQFDYSDRGILDRTHLRFFTRRTMLEMIEFAGLDIQHIRATPIPINMVEPFFKQTSIGKLIHRGLAFITRLFPTLFGYQFIVLAIKMRQNI